LLGLRVGRGEPEAADPVGWDGDALGDAQPVTSITSEIRSESERIGGGMLPKD
jgi:hypothetical protein